VINQVHKNTAPALRLLEAEGFERSDYVDIFDAGPTVKCLKHHVETIKNSQTLTVIIDDKANMQNNYILCNGALQRFRAVQASAEVNGEYISITSEVARALQIKDNDVVRIVKN
jgi:arginine N-succinyltransferase